MKPSSPLHGCAIVLSHHGLLIRGASGSGKSTLCQRLIDRWKDAGQFAEWVGDDQVFVETSTSRHIATAASEIAGFAERHFSGIQKVDHQTSAVLDLEVCLISNSQLERMPIVEQSDQFEGLERLNVPERASELAIELIIDRLQRI